MSAGEERRAAPERVLVQMGVGQLVSSLAVLLGLLALTVGLFVTRLEYAEYTHAMNERVARLERAQDALQGQPR